MAAPISTIGGQWQSLQISGVGTRGGGGIRRNIRLVIRVFQAAMLSRHRSFLPTCLSALTAICGVAVVATAQPYVHHVALPADATPDEALRLAANVVPSPQQLDYLDLGFTCFVHFGPNTFSGVEWGSGKEDPAIFNPGESLDTDQWCRVAKAAGMKMMLLTVKHHDGFCLWQSRYNTTHSVRSIPWRKGKGDVLKEMAASARKYGLKVGVYLSPADLYQMESANGLYGNGSKPRKSTIPTDPAAFQSDPTKVRADKPKDAPVISVEADDYNRYFMNQLYELLTEYGPIHEVWFDGAHPKTKGGQTYIKTEWFKMIQQLAPDGVIFGGPDVRWCGNEAGKTRKSEWSVLTVSGIEESGLDRPQDDVGEDAAVTAKQFDVYGKKYPANFLYYLVPEINTSIRAGWFWRNEHEQSVRGPDDVFDIYERAAGGNGVFLLNVPPDKSGRFAPRDVATLEEVGRRIRATYGDAARPRGGKPVDIHDGKLETYWQAAGKTGEVELTLPAARTINRVIIQEAISKVGQRVAAHAVDVWVDGKWTEIATATTIGYRKILRFPAVKTDRLRLRVLAARDFPAIAELDAAYYDAPVPAPEISRDGSGRLVIRPPAAAAFAWKPHGQSDASTAMAQSIHFTTDGSTPTTKSPAFTGPVDLPQGGMVKALIVSGGRTGPITDARLAIMPKGWKVVSANSEENAQYGAAKAIDGDPKSYWHTSWSKPDTHPHTLVVDMAAAHKVGGFTYLPRQDKLVPDGMVESGDIAFSTDGTTWSAPVAFQFGNLVNDPAQRTHLLKSPVNARYFRFTSKTGAAGKPYGGAAEIGILPAAR